MAESKMLSVRIDDEISDNLELCAKKEKRTKRAIVELALESYFRNSPAFTSERKENNEK